MQRVLPIISGTAKVSLRLIDWFVTNYTKRHNVTLVQQVNGHPVHFNVYASYRAQLKAYSKQQFDPFRRRDRIDFYYDRREFVETTIGQLNFFRWILQNSLLEYIEEHLEDIEAEMLQAQRAGPSGAPQECDGPARQQPREYVRLEEAVRSFSLQADDEVHDECGAVETGAPKPLPGSRRRSTRGRAVQKPGPSKTAAQASIAAPRTLLFD